MGISAKAVLTAMVAGLTLDGGGSLPANAQQNDEPPMSAREELRERFDLGVASSVRVRGIAGPVSVETGPGNAAEVHIVRTAATERELQCYRTDVLHRSGNLEISHVQFSDRPGCSSIRSRQTVRLRLPRAANLHLSTIGGRVDISATDGLVRLDSIAGHVTLAGARAVEVSSLANGLTVTLAPLSARGIRVSSVVGGVELNFRRNANADVRISSVQGAIGSDWPAQSGSGGLAYRIGSGGPDVSISSIIGPVTLRRF